MSVDKKYIKNLQGKDFILYAGLLDLAHSKGLKRISTQLVQVPTQDNGNVCIVTAEVELDGGKVFSGIGDASPNNVNRGIAVHAIRMAETRAKARALRDATNVDMAAFEEMGGDDEPEPSQAARKHPPATTKPQLTPEDEAFNKAIAEARKIVKNAGQRVTDGALTDALNRLVTKKAEGSDAEPVAIINYVAQAIQSKPEVLLNVLTPKPVNPEAPFVA